MPKYILGMDIGGTKCAINLASVNSHIVIVDRVSFDTDAEQGFEKVKEKLFQSAKEILHQNQIAYNDAQSEKNLFAIGVSCGGPLDCREGLILSPPHLPGWDKIPLKKMLMETFGVPAFVQNDANACALVEWKLGAGRGTQNMVFLTMGTGFGAGIIAENRLVEGVRGFAGEVGHVRLEKDGPLLFGKTGTVEAFCSGAGIGQIAKNRTEKWLKDGHEPVWVKAGLVQSEVNARTIAQYADGGDLDALSIYEEAGEKLGQILAILIDLLNPERIVIGSVFVRSENLLRRAMERVLKKEALQGSLADCQIVPAQTGEAIGDLASICAACYAMGIDIANPYEPKAQVMKHFNRLFERVPALKPLDEKLMYAFCVLRGSFMAKGKLLICGNGGSAADAEHIAGELMKGFLLKRPPNIPGVDLRLQRALPAICLSQHSALSTAFANDVDPELVFAQQLFGYGTMGDVLLCISTSGNARNCVEAAKTARAMGIHVIALTGKGGGRLGKYADVLLNVDSDYTPDVQELHLPLYHALCAMLEAEFFDE